MAPFNLILCFSIFLINIIILCLPPPTTSQHLLLPLTHSLSTTTTTNTHHLATSTATSAARHHHHHHHRHRQRVSLPLSAGSDYTLTFSLNSQTISVYMDTGSDVVWFPCSPFTCILCDTTTTTPPPPCLNVSKSSLVTCKSHACTTVHPSLSSSDLCAAANCPLDEVETSDCSDFACPSFYYAYGDGSLIAQLHTNDLIIPSTSKNSLILKNFTFGCSHSALAEPVGVAGFGLGPLSLPAQLGRHVSPDLGAQFSYCLVSHSFDSALVKHPSPLILGKYNHQEAVSGISHSGFVYTPMLDNPKHPYFYSVGLDFIRVGPKRIQAPESLKRVDGGGNGGVVVDSGTTYTMLPSELYNSMVAELDRRVSQVLTRASRVESSTGLSPCYYVEGVSSERVVPSLVFEFAGNASVVLPRRNYFYEFTMDGGDEMTKGRRVGCLMMMDGGDGTEEEESGGPGATLGNYQQQGFEVVYDLEMRRVGFARRKCAALWENLNRS